MRETIETITPEKATALLASSRGNRTMRAAHVQRLAADISAGRWKMTGDALRIAPDGDLVDGHHRCKAVIVANASITTRVLLDFPRDLVPFIDSGQAPRSNADALHFAGLNLVHAKERASTAQVLAAFERGVRPTRAILSNPEVIDALDRLDGRFEDIIAGAMRCRHIVPAPLVAAVVYAGTEKAGFARYAEPFLEGIATGAMLQARSPIHALREWAMKERQSSRKASRTDRLNATIRAWNSHCEGRRQGYIKATPPAYLAGSTPESFRPYQ